MPLRLSCFLLLAAIASHAAQVWNVRVEEPTGLYRRTGEVIAISVDHAGGAGFTVTDASGHELPWQMANGQLLFPVSLMPGELPVYRVSCCDARQAPPFENSIVLRRLGMRRIEFGNSIFRAIIDTGVPAFVEVYSLRAGPQRMLNLVETTPEGPGALKGDVHETSPEAATFSPPPVAGVDGPNAGWTTLGGKGPFTRVELLESGPLRGRVRLTRDGEAWDIAWTANSAWFTWKAKRGFRFMSISASPYEPFNRCVGGSEYDGPDGPGSPEPHPHDIAPRDWPTLPGGHMVYYQREENYGALGLVALDGELRWRGAGTRRVIAEKPAGDSQIAVSFPVWSGAETMMEARKENRLLREPVLVHVSAPSEGRVSVTSPLAREPVIERSARAATPFQPDSISLDGEWQLAFAAKGEGPPQSGWRTVSVPGTAHTQWLKPDEIYSHAAEWVSYKEWWYKKKFRVPEKFRGKRLRLQFEATDYYADTYINGAYAGHHEGYIDPYEYDITPLAPPGTQNEILVRVWTPVTYYWRHRPFTIKGAYGAVDQKPDDITPTGITRSVRIVASGGGVIRDVAVDTRELPRHDREGVIAEVTVQLDASEATNLTWELTLSPRNFNSSERYQARAPASAKSVTIPVPHPQLWWTWDHGKPNLYTLDVRLLDVEGRAVDGQSLAVGIREIEKIGWDFYLNGKRMFIRGTNYYDSIYMSEMNRAKYERDMKLMLGMNVNMIRLHCHYSNREFYDLADENGVLIWQDYLEAWYPHDRGFAQRAAELYDNHIRYVRNHPSVAIWITSDEEDFENYREITKHLAPRPFLVDPQRRPVQRSTGRFGDAHVYHGWYDGSIWEYTKMQETFVSELGATSLPNYDTLVKFMGDQWPIRGHAAEWTWRRLQIPEAMKAWGDPGGMTMWEYIPQTQAYVSRLFQIALERMRERKSEGAGGVLHFHAIDIWPSVTMAAIDFERTPTKVYDVLRRSFEPVAALFQYDRDRWQAGEKFTCGIWAVNDNWEAVPGASVRWRIVSSSVAELASGSFAAPMTADSAGHLGDVEWHPAKPGNYELRAEVIDVSGKRISENIYEFTVERASEPRP
jgi:beta-mannosidase